MTDKQITKYWYVLYTHSRCEFKVEESFKAQGITVFLPVKKAIKKWSDRAKEIISPLFTGYIFINATEKERLISLENKQVTRCLSDAGKPSIVPDWQIENLQKMIIVNPRINVIDGFYKGTLVEINSGPFKGIRGVIVNIDNKSHLAISIELINRTVLVHLNSETSINKL
ncbi:MAG: UpxY family transcription antiterminator [Ignavibacteriales bacterium]|nr:UpxY family transcription antiterminator [Ignavibacteriales bacterium]